MDPAAPDLDVASDTGAKYLLGALVAFLNPVIQGYAAFPGKKMISSISRGPKVIM